MATVICDECKQPYEVRDDIADEIEAWQAQGESECCPDCLGESLDSDPPYTLEAGNPEVYSESGDIGIQNDTMAEEISEAKSELPNLTDWTMQVETSEEDMENLCSNCGEWLDDPDQNDLCPHCSELIYPTDLEGHIDQMAERFPNGEDPMTQQPRTFNYQCVRCEICFTIKEADPIQCPECHTMHDTEGNEYRGQTTASSGAIIGDSHYRWLNVGMTPITFLVSDTELDLINTFEARGIDFVCELHRDKLKALLEYLQVIVNRDEFKKEHAINANYKPETDE